VVHVPDELPAGTLHPIHPEQSLEEVQNDPSLALNIGVHLEALQLEKGPHSSSLAQLAFAALSGTQVLVP